METQAHIFDGEVLERFPYLVIDQDNVAHYRGLLEQRLLMNRCEQCGNWMYPPRDSCPECWSTQVVPTEVSGKGFVYMLTTIHQGKPIEGLDFPFTVVAVELVEQEGLRYVTTIVNCPDEDIRIGMPVELTWVGRAGVSWPAFQPVTSGHQQV